MILTPRYEIPVYSGAAVYHSSLNETENVPVIEAYEYAVTANPAYTDGASAAAVYYSSPVEPTMSVNEAHAVYEVPVAENPEYASGGGVPGADPSGSATGRGMIHGKPRGGTAPAPTDEAMEATYSVFADPPQHFRAPTGPMTHPAAHTYYGDIPASGPGVDYGEPTPLPATEPGQYEMTAGNAPAEDERRFHTIVTTGDLTYAIPFSDCSHI